MEPGRLAAQHVVHTLAPPGRRGARSAHNGRVDHPTSLIYAGIDEAGYGPMLGPLCVGLTVFEVPITKPGAAETEDRAADSEATARVPGASDAPGSSGGGARKAPDLWSTLRGAVCREPREAKTGRIAVNDSKRLKLANDWSAPPWAPSEPSARSPLLHLERGVLAFAAASGASGAGDTPRSDGELFERLGTRLEPHPWYEGDALPLPLACEEADLRMRLNTLRSVLAATGVRVVAVRARVVGEAAFNAGCERTGSKGAVNFEAAASLLREVWSRAGGPTPPGGPRVVFDRHGGRTSYGGLLAHALEGAEVETLEESERASRYRVREAGGRGREAGGEGREATVIFQPKADAAHLPVALASMVAKYLRELAMARFNRHFCGRASSLTPTAGYVGDARRWLRDAAPVITREERATLVRRQ